jgi:hypothetical protein
MEVMLVGERARRTIRVEVREAARLDPERDRER